jgi:YVTN family beta-propeller protein
MDSRRCMLLLAIVLCQLPSVPLVAQVVIDSVRTGATPMALAVDQKLNKIYVVNQGSNSLTVIDGATDSPVTVPVGHYPTAVAVNPATGRVYVVNHSDSTVSVLQPPNYSVRTVPTGKWPQSVAVNPVTNGIYITNDGDNTVSVINGTLDYLITNVPVGRHPDPVAVNPANNKIYVANVGSNTVTVMDGPTLATTSVNVGSFPYALAINALNNQVYAVNYGGTVTVINEANVASTIAVGAGPDAVAIDPMTNLAYVTNSGDGSVTVIDGATFATKSVSIGGSPGVAVANPVTNKVYVTDLQAGTVTVIDGTNDSTSQVYVDTRSVAVALNPLGNRIYVANQMDNTVSVIAGASANPLQFVAVAPCRVADTRNPAGPFGGPSIPGGSSRSFPIPSGPCAGIPQRAAAYSLNVTVIPHGALGYLTIWPAGEDQPVVSTMNSPDGRVKANAAIVSAGGSSAVKIYVSNTADVVLDINGYFVSPSSQGALAFYPLTPCRVADTRQPAGRLGAPFLHGGQMRDFPVQQSACGIPDNAQAYSMNFTVVPKATLGYLSVWPSGQPQPVVSTLNDPTGTTAANAAIVPAGTGGDVDVYASQDTELIIDINGYFAAPAAGGLSLYPSAACRVLDTRQSGGAFSGQLAVPFLGAPGNPCGLGATARALVLNATALPAGGLGFLTLWADGQSRPRVSTLNATDGAFTSNMAIVPTVDGAIDAYASGPTQLLLDVSSYFAP